MNSNKCLYCYKEVAEEGEFHASCSQKFFAPKISPAIPYSLNEMSELAKTVVQRSITVPGVQPKLSVSFIDEVSQNSVRRSIVVGALGGNYIFKPPSLDYE